MMDAKTSPLPIIKLSSSQTRETYVKGTTEPEEDPCFDFSAAWFSHPQNYGAGTTAQPKPSPQMDAGLPPAPMQVLKLTRRSFANSSANLATVDSSQETLQCPHCSSLNATKSLVIQNHFSHCHLNIGCLQENMDNERYGPTGGSGAEGQRFANRQLPQTLSSEPTLGADDEDDCGHADDEYTRHERRQNNRDKAVVEDRYRSVRYQA